MAKAQQIDPHCHRVEHLQTRTQELQANEKRKSVEALPEAETQLGHALPSLRILRGDTKARLPQLLRGKRILLFGVMGAFNKKSEKRVRDFCRLLPGFRRYVHRVVCVAVNDPIVLTAWGEQLNKPREMVFLSDWSGKLAKSIGMDIDMSESHLGLRCNSFSTVIDNSVFCSISLGKDSQAAAVLQNIREKWPPLPESAAVAPKSAISGVDTAADRKNVSDRRKHRSKRSKKVKTVEPSAETSGHKTSVDQSSEALDSSERPSLNFPVSMMDNDFFVDMPNSPKDTQKAPPQFTRKGKGKTFRTVGGGSLKRVKEASGTSSSNPAREAYRHDPKSRSSSLLSKGREGGKGASDRSSRKQSGTQSKTSHKSKRSDRSSNSYSEDDTDGSSEVSGSIQTASLGTNNRIRHAALTGGDRSGTQEALSDSHSSSSTDSRSYSRRSYSTRSYSSRSYSTRTYSSRTYSRTDSRSRSHSRSSSTRSRSWSTAIGSSTIQSKPSQSRPVTENLTATVESMESLPFTPRPTGGLSGSGAAPPPISPKSPLFSTGGASGWQRAASLKASNSIEIKAAPSNNPLARPSSSTVTPSAAAVASTTTSAPNPTRYVQPSCSLVTNMWS